MCKWNPYPAVKPPTDDVRTDDTFLVWVDGLPMLAVYCDEYGFESESYDGESYEGMVTHWTTVDQPPEISFKAVEAGP